MKRLSKKAPNTYHNQFPSFSSCIPQFKAQHLANPEHPPTQQVAPSIFVPNSATPNHIYLVFYILNHAAENGTKLQAQKNGLALTPPPLQPHLKHMKEIYLLFGLLVERDYGNRRQYQHFHFLLRETVCC